jgi:rare lipoprotein A
MKANAFCIFLLLAVTQIQAQSEHDKKQVFIGWASYYHDMFHGRKTSSGEIYNKNKLSAAHRTLPLGTRVKVTNLKTKRWVIVRINDRGPRPKRRIIDLSKRAARHLGMLNGKGVIKVKVEVLPFIPPLPNDSFRLQEGM